MRIIRLKTRNRGCRSIEIVFLLYEMCKIKICARWKYKKGLVIEFFWKEQMNEKDVKQQRKERAVKLFNEQDKSSYLKRNPTFQGEILLFPSFSFIHN